MKKETGASALLMLLLGVGLLGCSKGAAEGARQALSSCGRVLIPSLFPFLVLSVLVSSTEAGQLLTRPAAWLGQVLYGAPPQAASAVLMSWIGGYPSGAKALSQLVQEGRLSSREAENVLCFGVNSGPAFLISVVGSGIFGSAKSGMELYFCQLAAGAVTARLLLPRHWAEQSRPPEKRRFQPLGRAVSAAVVSAAGSMTAICGFVVFCGAVSGILTEMGWMTWTAEKLMLLSGGRVSVRAAEVFLKGTLEICGGISGAAELPFRETARLLPFLVSFGGISVLFQIAACFPEEGIHFSSFLRSRVVHGLLTLLFSLPLSKRWAAEAAMSAGKPVLAYSGRGMAQGICLIALLVIGAMGSSDGRAEPFP